MTITVREKQLSSGKKSLYLDIYKDGKRSYEFLKLYLTGNKQQDKQTRELAENIRAKRQLEYAHGKHGFQTPHKQSADFLAYFEKDRDSLTNSKGQQATKSTKKQYSNLYKKLRAYAGDSLKFKEITPEWVKEFRDFLLEELGNNTARTYFAMFKASLKRAVPKYYTESPARHVKGISKENGKGVHYLELKELKALAAAECANKEVKAAFLFSCNTGLRYSDVEKLLWNEIRGGRIEFMQKKTSNVEYVPLNKTAQRILDQRDKSFPKVFQLPTNAMANIHLKEWVKNAGLKRWEKVTDPETGDVLQSGLNYHMSRHTFSVNILSHGGDIYTLKELLGHTSITSTEIYAKIINKTKQSTVNQLPEL